MSCRSFASWHFDAVDQQDRKTFIHHPEPSLELHHLEVRIDWDGILMRKENETCFIGVGIEKSKLDVDRPDSKASIQLNNTGEDTQEFSKKT